MIALRHRWGALVALLAVASAPALAADEGEAVMQSWDFASSADSLGWVALHSVKQLTVQGGALRAEVTGSDPYIASPPFVAKTSAFQIVRITLRSNVSGRAALYWAAAEDPETAQFRAGDEVAVDVRAGTEWQVLNVIPGWAAGLTLTRLRWDPPDGDGVVNEIRSIEIVERVVPAKLPDRPVYSFATPSLASAFLPGNDMSRAYGEGDTLVCVTGGPYAMLLSPPFELDSKAAGIASLTLRTTAPVRIDVLFQRRGASLFPPADSVGLSLPASAAFRTVNLDLRNRRGYSGSIQRLALRLSEAPAGTRVELRGVAIVDRPRGGPQLELLECRLPGPVTPMGPRLDVTCTVVNRGGTSSPETLIALELPVPLTDGSATKLIVPSLPPLQTATVTAQIAVPKDWRGGEVRVRARLGDDPPLEARTVVVRAPDPAVAGGDPARVANAFLTPDNDAVLRNAHISLVFPGGIGGFGAGLLFHLSGRTPRLVAGFPSLGCAVRPGGVLESLRTDDRPLAASGPAGAQITFPLSLDLGGQRCRGGASFRLRSEEAEVECELALRSESEVRLSGLLFPDFAASHDVFATEARTAVFPGLEYLLPGERSSDMDFVAPPAHLRIAPHPYKVTVPCMWVSAGGVSVGLRWDPLLEWRPSGGPPTAVFSSPDRLTYGTGHRMGLLAPGVMGGGPENSLESSPPAPIPAGHELILRASIYVVQGADVEAPLRHVVKRLTGDPMAPPPLPEPRPRREGILDGAAYALTHDVWDAESSRWFAWPGHPGPSHYDPKLAHFLWYYLVVRGGDARPEAADVLRAAMEAQGPALGWEFAFHERGLRDAVLGRLAQGRSMALSEDGSGPVPYRPASALQASFGMEGDSSSGLTGWRAVDLLRAAALTLDPVCIRAGLQLLRHLDTEPRPEGAQTWELPLHVPDILAAAHAVRAYCLGYQLTGDPRLLDSARRWAWRGMVFVYLWGAPDRPIMRYGSIPVFGATHYTSPWFGIIVQWNGLWFAEALMELAPLDDGFDWHTVAEGLVASAAQQMRPLDPGERLLPQHVPECGHLGCYPDAYSALLGTDAYHFCLEPSMIARLATQMAGLPGWPLTRVVRSGSLAASVTTLASVTEATVSDNGVAFTTSLPATFGPHCISVAGMESVDSVLVGESALPMEASIDAAGVGAAYEWVPEEGLVFIRLEPADEPVATAVRGKVRTLVSGSAGT